MIRQQARFLAAAALFVALLAVAPSARADGGTLFLEGDCYFKVGPECTQACAGPINCDIQFAQICGTNCTEDGSASCVDGCQTRCTKDAGPFSCSTDCGGKCEVLCANHDAYGAASNADCVTACQA